MADPNKAVNYVREVLLQTAAQWSASSAQVLTVYETGRETDTGKEKTGDGTSTWAELPYDAPAGQIYELTDGTPTGGDQIAYNVVTAAVAATASLSCTDQGTVGSQLLVGGKQYTIVASGATGDQIDRGADADAYADNIATKVTTDAADTLCTAADVTGTVTFTASTVGAAGNDITLFTTDDSAITSLTPFASGADQVNVLKRSSVTNFGGGDVDGPASATADAAAAFNSTTGKLIKDGAAVNVLMKRALESGTSTATAVGTTTLTVASNPVQIFTGSTTQTITLPVVTTLIKIGFQFLIINDSSGSLTINSSGANLVQTLTAGTTALLTCVALTGTSAASWDSFTGGAGIGGTVGSTDNAVPRADGTGGSTLHASTMTVADDGSVNIAVVSSNIQITFGRTTTNAGTGRLYANDTYVGLGNTGGSDLMTWAQSGATYAQYDLYVDNVGFQGLGLAGHATNVLKNTSDGTDIRGLHGGGTAVASAAAMPLPTGRVFHVTGTTNITSITSTNFASGVVITMIFDDILTVSDANNINLSAAFVSTAGDSLTLAYDGTNWYEIGRSVN